MDKTLKEKFLAVLERENVERLCACVSATPTLEQMKAVNAYWPDAHYKSKLMAKLASAAHEIVGFDAIRFPFDMGVEAEALGCGIKEGTIDRQPSVVTPAFSDLNDYKIPEDFLHRGRIPVVIEACEILKSRYYASVALLPAIIGPFTVTCHAFGIEKVLKATIKDSNELKRATEDITMLLIDYARVFLRSGIEIINISDPTASGDLLSPRIFSEFVLPTYKIIRENIDAKIILHICGNTSKLLNFIPQTKFEGFSFQGPEVDVKLARDVIGGRTALIGNVSTDTLLNGGINEVKSSSLRALEEGIDVLAPACAIPLHTPLKNLQTMVETVKQYNLNAYSGRVSDS